MLLAPAALGHLVFWVALVNRIHSLGIPKRKIDILSGLAWAGLFTLPVALWGLARGLPVLQLAPQPLPLQAYLGLAAVYGFYAIARHLRDALAARRRPQSVLAYRDTPLGLEAALGHCPVRPGLCTLFSRLPGNQLLDLRLVELTLQLERLPAELDGLSVVHLSDLHMSGRLTREYFEHVCTVANEQQPDLIVISGDLFDANACFDWVPTTLARLEARHGVYFVLGNHDLRIDHARARRVLVEAGLVDLGGRCLTLTIRGKSLLLAGNEQPWFGPAPRLDEANPHVFRLLVSHAPDQLAWARRHDVDLMLAGHTHGGQIRLPLVGPIISPSRYGTRYAAGTFYAAPTLMHVSRGTATLDPLRWNCPPEIGLLTLRSAAVCRTDEQSATATAPPV